jgi:hypothetical protein
VLTAARNTGAVPKPWPRCSGTEGLLIARSKRPAVSPDRGRP